MAGPRRVAFLGLGIMGAPQAANVARAGFELTVWNRTRERAEAFAAEHGGVQVADTPAAAAAAADIAVTMVPDVPEVEAVLLGPSGVAEGLAPGGLAIDMSTIAPTASRRIAAQLRERDIHFLDAPVTGSRPKAEDGTLTIMVGGEKVDFERARPLLESMGGLVVHAGPTGHGEMVKLINNTTAAINAAALAEALTLARAADLDTEVVERVMGSGSGGSTMLSLKAGPMLSGQYEPLFKLEHMLKDVRHCLREAEALGLDLPLARLAESFYARAAEEGRGGEDFAAVIEAVAAVARGA
jgi:3-hydroxyisobutyrate dehydrogenase-like beta-hydroxyacid dehydrogenase